MNHSRSRFPSPSPPTNLLSRTTARVFKSANLWPLFTAHPLSTHPHHSQAMQLRVCILLPHHQEYLHPPIEKLRSVCASFVMQVWAQYQQWRAIRQPKEVFKFCEEELNLEFTSVVYNESKVAEKWMHEYGQYLGVMAISCDSFNLAREHSSKRQALIYPKYINVKVKTPAPYHFPPVLLSSEW